MNSVTLSEYQIESRVGDFIALLKPRVMMLVVFTAFTGMIAAPGLVHPVTATIAMLAVALGAGAAGALNMWFDRDIDQTMTRTAQRPLPAGRVAPDDALAFAMIVGLFAVTIMGFAVHYIAAFWLAFSMAFYVIIYTMWLKRRTPYNIVIGGFAGALPPLIGWVVVSPEPAVLPWLWVALIFTWTCPHFWALALLQKEDYANANVPMMPNIYGNRRTKNEMLFYGIATIAISFLPVWVANYSASYAMAAGLLAMYWMCPLVALWREEGLLHARAVFWRSILYLFLLFLAVIIESLSR